MMTKLLLDQFVQKITRTRTMIILILLSWTITSLGVAGCVVTFVERTSQAQVAPPGATVPSITLEPAIGSPESYVTVRGEGWPIDSLVLIYLLAPGETRIPDYAVAGSATGPEGRFTTGFSFPPDSRWAGQQTVTVIARTDEGRIGAQAYFRFTGPDFQPTETPTVIIEPTAPSTVTVEPILSPTVPIEPSPTPTVEPPTPTRVPQPFLPILTAITDLNIRGGPGIGYPILGLLRAGQSAVVTGVSVGGGWWQIKFSGVAEGRGWVSASYVVAKNTNNVPVVKAPPLLRTPTPASVVVDWRGEYYNNISLAGAPVLVRNDVAINFNWGAGSPAPGLPVDNFSARWTRTMWFDEGQYRFHVIIDDGVRLYVDDVLVLDDWRDGGWREIIGERWLSSGNHAMRVEYYEHTGEAFIQVWWEKVSHASSYPDWKGEYWANPDLSGNPTLVRNDAAIDFNWGTGSPAAGLPTDNFSARWTRTLYFSDGVYRFHAVVDDGVRVYVDGSLVIDDWRDGGRRELIGDRWLWNGNHDLRVEYYERVGEALIIVWAEKISGGGSVGGREPEADFDADPRSGDVPLRVEFDNDSEGDFDDCKWEFGDDEINRDCDDPDHTYWEAGRYTVRLRVRGPGGEDTKKKSDYITVRPVADFTATPRSGQQPLTVNFSNRSTEHDIREWDFGDGNTSTENNPTHIYTAPGVYTVRLRVKEAGIWSNTREKSNYIIVTNGPTPEPTPTPTDRPTRVPPPAPTNTPTSQPTRVPRDIPPRPPTNTPTPQPTREPIDGPPFERSAN